MATAVDGLCGFKAARALRPRVILLDVTMPRMDCWSVLRTLRADQDLCDTPIVMVTVLNEQKLAFSFGATDYLQKPIDCGELEATLARFRPNACGEPVPVLDDAADARKLLSDVPANSG